MGRRASPAVPVAKVKSVVKERRTAACQTGPDRKTFRSSGLGRLHADLGKPLTRILFDGDNPALTGQAWWQVGAIDAQPTVFHGLVTESFLYDGVDHPIYSATNLLGIGCSQAGHSQSLEYFYHADERGSVKAVTFGSSGLYCEAASYTYQGYGAGSTPTDGRPGFAGAPSDASGVVFMRNRAYDPNTGTFTQPDPIGLAGGINLYGYAGNDPIMFTDPFGLRVTVVGEDIRQAVIHLLHSSPTFARVFAALQREPTSRVNLTIRAASLEDLGRMFDKNHKGGMTDHFPNTAGGTVVIDNGGQFNLEAVIAHEVGGHAGGAYSDRADTGIDKVCGYLGSTGAETCANQVGEVIGKEQQESPKDKKTKEKQ